MSKGLRIGVTFALAVIVGVVLALTDAPLWAGMVAVLVVALFGVPFLAGVYHELRDRAEAAEAEVARLKISDEGMLPDDEWKMTLEKVEPHGLCCGECKQVRESLARLRDGLRRIANRYCLHSSGDSQQESVCEGKPISERCSVCIARALLADQDGAA